MSGSTVTIDQAGRDILTAGAEVFGRQGYKKTSVQDIIDAAGVSRPLFYRRFRDKRHVFSLVVDRVIIEWNRVLVQAVADAGNDTCAKLKALQEVSLEYASSRSLLHQLLTRDAQMMLAEETDVTARGEEALRALIAEILENGVSRGEVRVDVALDHMVDLITQVHLAYTTRAVRSGAPLDRGLVSALTACLLHGIIGEAHVPCGGGTPPPR